jgi:hypothetical protein
MRHTFLALSVAVLAIFATAVHADDGAALGSTVALPQARQSLDHLLVALGMPDLVRPPHLRVTPATVVGKGTLGTDCHASNAIGDYLNDGTYSDSDMGNSHKGENLWCCGPLGTKNSCYNCDNSSVTCKDGKRD